LAIRGGIPNWPNENLRFFACAALISVCLRRWALPGFFAFAALVSVRLRRWVLPGLFAFAALVSVRLLRWPFLVFLLVY
jgi:hypothetical protein